MKGDAIAGKTDAMPGRIAVKIGATHARIAVRTVSAAPRREAPVAQPARLEPPRSNLPGRADIILIRETMDVLKRVLIAVSTFVCAGLTSASESMRRK